MVSAPALENAMTSDGCFPGYRIVNEKAGLITSVDMVVPLLKGVAIPYKHPKMKTQLLTRFRQYEKECGWESTGLKTWDVGLHDRPMYEDRTVEKLPDIRGAGEVALAVSYTHDTAEAARFVEGYGYRLVGSAVRSEEASHLIQDPSTGDCYLTFEGSDTFDDWVQNFQILLTRFCGLGQRVHTGFRNKIMDIITRSNFAQDVRPKLGHCRKVEAVGHSLGGAMATLFTACAHNTVMPDEDGFSEWDGFWWTKKETKIMDSIA